MRLWKLEIMSCKGILAGLKFVTGTPKRFENIVM